MISLNQSQTIAQPILGVFNFLANFENRVLFESAVVDVNKASDGDMGIGTRFREMRKAMGWRTVTEFEIVKFESPGYLQFKSISGTVEIEGSYTLAERDDQTNVNFEITMKPRGMMIPMTPLIASTTRKALPKYYATLKTVLEAKGSK